MSDLRYWVGFNIVRGIGPVRFRALLDHFGNAERAWAAPYESLRAAGLDRRSLESLVASRGQIVSCPELCSHSRRAVPSVWARLYCTGVQLA